MPDNIPKALEGPVLAILTPFDATGRIAYGLLRDYLHFLWATGVRNIVVNGTTGEFASLTLEERMEVAAFCRRYFNGKVICHVSCCAVEDCLRLVAHAEEHADALLLLPPFYYAHPATEGVLMFLRAVLSETHAPVFLYNFPRHAQASIAPEVLARLGEEFSNMVGVKDSAGDLATSEQFQSQGRFQVYVGSDTAALEVLRRGLSGSVTGGGNPVPEALVRIYDDFTAGETEAAQRAQGAFDIWTSFRKRLAIDEIAVAKAGVGQRVAGFPLHVRPPLVALPPELVGQVNEQVRQAVQALTLSETA